MKTQAQLLAEIRRLNKAVKLAQGALSALLDFEDSQWRIYERRAEAFRKAQAKFYMAKQAMQAPKRTRRAS